MNDWQAAAACQGMDSDIFFPASYRHDSDDAKAVCATCPVKDDCLRYAVEHNEESGIFGGLTPHERKPHRRAYVARQQARARKHGTRHYYVNGCHCDECTAANTAWHRKYAR